MGEFSGMGEDSYSALSRSRRALNLFLFFARARVFVCCSSRGGRMDSTWGASWWWVCCKQLHIIERGFLHDRFVLLRLESAEGGSATTLLVDGSYSLHFGRRRGNRENLQ